MGCPTEANFTRFGCSGISTIGAGGQGVFLPGHMGDNLVFGLSVISVSFCFKILSKAVCILVIYRGRKCFKVFVSSRCNDLEINKAFLIEKNTGAVHNKFTDVWDALKLY
jgi:hypothetical protein